MSYLDIAEWIISTAQQANPKLNGQIDPTLNQLIIETNLEDNHSALILHIRIKTLTLVKNLLLPPLV
jgi:hypothetical protein